MKGALVILALALPACPGPYEEACSASDLARIERAYQAELARYCGGQDERCSEKLRIDAKYRAQRADWVRCDRESQQ